MSQRGIYKRLGKMLRINSTNLPLVQRELPGVTSVLDVGCGLSSPLREIPKRFYSVGVDVFKPTLTALKAYKSYDDLVLADGRHLPFKGKIFDVVLSLEVIEHMNKQEGYNFLIHLSRLAKKKLIVSTPSGFLPQGEYDNNVHQRHLSGWCENEFKALGFRVVGFGGLKSINKIAIGVCRAQGNLVSSSPIRLLLNLVIFIFADAAQYLTSKKYADKSRQIFCVKVFNEDLILRNN